VGDAAGTGSFFRGRGANHALETAEIAGRLFKTGGYESFESEMDKATGAFIEDSAFLFIERDALL
jgi:flavin-dependent dehydrogenase